MPPELGSILGFIMGDGAVALVVFVIWYLQHKTDSKKWDSLIRIEDEKWTSKFRQEKEERDRQYQVFTELMEQNSINTGNLATLKTDLDNVGDKVEKLEGRVDDGFNGLHRRLDLLVRKEN